MFGFEVRVDASWLLLAVLIILSLTTGYFPFHYQDLSAGAYAVMGLSGALGLFASIVVHEMCHSLVARRFGVQMKGISLFIFGGVAEMEDECRTPKGEFLMATAGPVASVVLSGLFYGIYAGLAAAGAPAAVAGVPAYLAWINMVLALFNLLPAFPLDGGRVLRAALWAWKDNLRWATRIAAAIGAGFGVALVVLGVLTLLAGSLVGGLWWCLIGMFLRGISHGSYRQVVIRETLAGEPVRRFMREHPVTVRPELSVEALVNDYIYRHHFKMFPVVADGRLIGCAGTQEVKELPREAWARTAVGDIAAPCSPENTIAAEADATMALATMNKAHVSRLMVVRDGRLLGVVSLRDMLAFLALKLDLEGGDRDARRLGAELRGA